MRNQECHQTNPTLPCNGSFKIYQKQKISKSPKFLKNRKYTQRKNACVILEDLFDLQNQEKISKRTTLHFCVCIESLTLGIMEFGNKFRLMVSIKQQDYRNLNAGFRNLSSAVLQQLIKVYTSLVNTVQNHVSGLSIISESCLVHFL